MSDFISRQDVLDVLRNLAFDHMFQCGEYYGEDERQLTIINARKAIDVIEAMPSVEPERKRGEWVKEDMSGYLTPGGNSIYHCSECGRTEGPCPYPRLTDFCPSCGADMRGEHE